MQENINIPDSTITTNLSFRNLVLMNMQQLTNFPYIENDFDALTDYELLCLVVKYLNDVISNQNEQNDSITRMYESFLALQTYVNNTKDTLEDAFNNLDNYVRDYFANLDVQEEINNKLDEMAQDGTLATIINNYIRLNCPLIFNTVAEMKLSTQLVNGSYAHTLGFYNKGDFGEAYYTITNTGTANEKDVIALQNNLYAVLLSSKEIIPEQYGAYGDTTHDDSDVLQYILDNTNSKKAIKLNGYYLVSSGLNSDKPRNIYATKIDCGIVGTTSTYILKIERDENDTADYRNYYMRDITISQRGEGHALYIKGWSDRLREFKIENCKLFTPYSDSVGYALYSDNSLSNCVIYGCNICGHGIGGDLRDANLIQKNLFFGKGYGIHVDIPNGCISNAIKDNVFSIYGANAIYIVNGEEVLIDGNQIEYPDITDQESLTKGMIYLEGTQRRCKKIIITNNNLGGGTHLDYLIWLANADDCIIDNNRLVACNNAEIYISSGAMRNIIRKGNYGVSTPSNSRSDLVEKYIVDDNGLGTIGTWKKLLSQGSSSRYLYFMKTEDNLIHFQNLYLTSIVEPTICQLPLYFRPKESVIVECVTYTSHEKVLVKFLYDGTVSLLNFPSSQDYIFIQANYECNRYAS